MFRSSDAATELDVLSNLAAISVGGRSAIVAVTGEPGIGKSRLVDEVVTTIMAERPDTFLLEGVCAPYGESNVWWPVAGGLLGRLGSRSQLAGRRVARAGARAAAVVRRSSRSARPSTATSSRS